IDCGLGLELADKHNVAGVVDAAGIHADFQMKQPWNAAAQSMKAPAQQFDVSAPLLGGGAANVPHHDVTDHVASLQAGAGSWQKAVVPRLVDDSEDAGHRAAVIGQGSARS